MSAPIVNSVLPAAGVPSPVCAAASIPLPPVKPAVPATQAVKPQVNHTPPIPNAGVELSTKSPEKPKEIPPKPTANGVEEPLVNNNALVVDVPEPPPPAPPLPAAIPAVIPASVPVVAPVPEPAAPIALIAAVPAPVPASVPQNAALEPEKEPVVDRDAVPSPLPQPEPVEAASPLEPSKPKAAKPQAAKRRREPRALTPPAEDGTPEKKPRRTRAPVSPYQSPLPEIATVISRSLKIRDNSQKTNDDKLIVFYKNEFLAVRNAEGGFYLCQTMQNIYRSSHKIRIRWLSCDTSADGTKDAGIYIRDFYDKTDFECILTTVALDKVGRDNFSMPPAELERVESILKRALDVEKGSEQPAVTEEHPDGLDLSLYRDESQLQKSKAAKRRHSPVPKVSSPKRVKKPKKAQSKGKSTGINAAQPSTSAKTKTPARKPPAKRAPSPPLALIEKKTRAERSLAREKVLADTSKATNEKPTKSEKPAKSKAKPKAARGKKKAPPKVEKVVEVKTDKKQQDKKKGKAVVASPVASTSKKAVVADKHKSNTHRPMRKRK